MFSSNCGCSSGASSPARRSLLEFSRDREFRTEPLLLRPLVEETVRFLKGQIPPGVSVEVSVPAEITLPGDRQRLQQVFLNLVKNAAEAVPAEDGRIVVSARRVLSGKGPETDAALVVHGAGLAGSDVIEIEVLDNGPGSGCSSSTRLSRNTTAALPWRAASGAGRSSRSGCPREGARENERPGPAADRG